MSAVSLKSLPFTCHFLEQQEVTRGYVVRLAYDGNRQCVVFCYQLLKRRSCADWHIGMMQKPVPSAPLFCAFSRDILPQTPLYVVNPAPSVLFDDLTQFFQNFVCPT